MTSEASRGRPPSRGQMAPLPPLPWWPVLSDGFFARRWPSLSDQCLAGACRPVSHFADSRPRALPPTPRPTGETFGTGAKAPPDRQVPEAPQRPGTAVGTKSAIPTSLPSLVTATPSSHQASHSIVPRVYIAALSVAPPTTATLRRTSSTSRPCCAVGRDAQPLL